MVFQKSSPVVSFHPILLILQLLSSCSGSNKSFTDQNTHDMLLMWCYAVQFNNCSLSSCLCFQTWLFILSLWKFLTCLFFLFLPYGPIIITRWNIFLGTKRGRKRHNWLHLFWSSRHSFLLSGWHMPGLLFLQWCVIEAWHDVLVNPMIVVSQKSCCVYGIK